MNSKIMIPIIHKIQDGMYGENQAFNGCMRYLMECFSELPEYDYWFFEGVSGDCFTPVYYLEDIQRGIDVACLTQYAFDDEIVTRVFDACGYNVLYVKEPELRLKMDLYINKIIEYIDKGIPVITRSCDDCSEFSIICGYENNGATLYFLNGDRSEPIAHSGKLRGLVHRCIPTGLIFVGDKKEKPSLADVYRQTIYRIPIQMNLPIKDGVLFGRAAFEAWVNTLKNITDGNGWMIHGRYSCLLAALCCALGEVKRCYEYNPDMKFCEELIDIYEKMQIQFENLCQVGFDLSSDDLKDVQKKKPVIEIINKCVRLCDVIIKVFN